MTDTLAMPSLSAALDPKALDELVMIYAQAADGIGCERGSFLYDEIARGLTMVLLKLAGWRMIDTAPRDGRYVLIAARDIYSNNDPGGPKWKPVLSWWCNEGTTRSKALSNRWAGIGTHWNAEFWMPIPDMPQ